jgi:hypothetical protein
MNAGRIMLKVKAWPKPKKRPANLAGLEVQTRVRQQWLDGLLDYGAQPPELAQFSSAIQMLYLP